jgi:hypothetical protein
MVLDAAPSTIYEGQGVDNSAPVMLVISGHHFIQGATVQISPSTDLTLGTPTISNNGDFIAVPVTIAVNTTTNTGAVALTITVNENGASATQLPNKLSLAYLPQLTGGTLALPLAERYSQVSINASPNVTGSGSVIIRSMSSIKCGGGTGAIDLRGGTGASAVAAGPAGPGGCAGGAEATNGGCTGVGGGAAGAAGVGGGGGGYGTAGGGAGTVFGAAHGSPLIVSYAGMAADGSDRNQSSGGGGGAAALGATGNGGGGGGGGGTIELTAGGDITCGTIDVSGGTGHAGATLAGAAGGGGGGSGGVIVARTSHGMISATLTADLGGGGAGAGGGGQGGPGGTGRIRFDLPGATLPTTSPVGVAHRGLAFAASAMPFYTMDNPTVTIVGTPLDVFDMYVVDSAGMAHTGEPINQEIDGTGMKTVLITLLPGYNRVCATIHGGMRNKDDRFSLADTCIETAYLP